MRRGRLRKIFALAVMAVVCVFFGVNVWWKIQDVTDEEKVARVAGLPVMEITLNGITLTEIHDGEKSVKYGGNALTLTTGEEITEYANVEIKGRGNSTWGVPKRPYQIKFQDKVALLGMDKAKKWVLLANAFDASEMRTDVAFYLERMLGAEYALSGEFVKLRVDGEDLGVYFVTPKMEIDKSRIDLRDPLGILVEVDNLHAQTDECWRTRQGNCLVVSDVVNEDEVGVAMTSFVELFSKFEEAAEKGDYETVSELVDLEGLAKYYLLEEFTVNPDAYNTSYYFYRDGLDDKIHVGPGWDFDYALGNRAWRWGYAEDFHSPLKTQVQRLMAFGGELHDAATGELHGYDGNLTITRMMYYLMDMPEFYKLVRETFVGMMQGKKMELLSYVESRLVMAGGEIRKDNKLWGRDDFDEEIEWLFWWLETRYDYFEQVYGA